MAGGATVSAGLTQARMGLYWFNPTTTQYELQAQTASDTTLFNASGPNTLYTRIFDTTGGFPSNYTLVAGQRYALGLHLLGTTPPTVLGALMSTSLVSLLEPRIASSRLFTGGLPNPMGSTSSTTNILWGRFS
jgi:hypothetical protein